MGSPTSCGGARWDGERRRFTRGLSRAVGAGRGLGGSTLARHVELRRVGHGRAVAGREKVEDALFLRAWAGVPVAGPTREGKER